MDEKKFNNDLREALRRMQPDVPGDMTGRFMDRMRREGATAPTPAPAPQRRTLRIATWLSSAVAAAAVALFFLLPGEAPRHVADVHKNAQAKAVVPVLQRHDKNEVAPAMPQPEESAASLHNIISATGNNRSTSTASAACKHLPEINAEPTAEPYTANVAEAPTQEASIPDAVESPQYAAAEAKKQAGPFTANELILMERAERMNLQAVIYAAEARQEALVKSREAMMLHVIQNNSKKEKPITRNV